MRQVFGNENKEGKKNKYTINNNGETYLEIYTKDEDDKWVMNKCFVDERFIPYLKSSYWTVRRDGYVKNRSDDALHLCVFNLMEAEKLQKIHPNKSICELQSMVDDAPDGTQIDHSNKNKLCNTSENLRRITIKQNQFNRTTIGKIKKYKDGQFYAVTTHQGKKVFEERHEDVEVLYGRLREFHIAFHGLSPLPQDMTYKYFKDIQLIDKKTPKSKINNPVKQAVVAVQYTDEEIEQLDDMHEQLTQRYMDGYVEVTE